MSTKLTNTDKSMMSVFARSPKQDGWAKVSAVVMPLFNDVSPGLFDIEKNEDGTGRARLTSTGETLAAWL